MIHFPDVLLHLLVVQETSLGISGCFEDQKMQCFSHEIDQSCHQVLLYGLVRLRFLTHNLLAPLAWDISNNEEIT